MQLITTDMATLKNKKIKINAGRRKGVARITGLPLWVVFGGRQRLSAPDPPSRLQALLSFKVSPLLYDVVKCVYTVEMELAK